MSKKKPRPQPEPARTIEGLVDAHTHLASCSARSPEEVAALMRRARAAGVQWVCTVGDGLEEAREALRAAQDHLDVYAACAVHPTRAGELTDDGRAELAEMAADPRCVAIGETGLDWYWLDKLETCADRRTQIDALLWHAELAAETGKALMIHNREADRDLMAVLRDVPDSVRVMLHCFSSPLDVARQALDRGYVLSFSGNVTFRANHELRAAAALAPVGQIVVETDAPYMTPEPYRGGRNESTFIGHTALCIADARDENVQAAAEHMARTAAELFGVQR